MNTNGETRLEEYEKSDFNKRLHLFLQFPELRSEFLAIDQDSGSRTKSFGPGPNRKPMFAHLSVMLHATVGSIKKVLN